MAKDRQTKPFDPNDPEGGHDPEALREAAEKFHVATVPEKESTAPGGRDRSKDPVGGHDPSALDEAARRTKAEPE